MAMQGQVMPNQPSYGNNQNQPQGAMDPLSGRTYGQDAAAAAYGAAGGNRAGYVDPTYQNSATGQFLSGLGLNYNNQRAAQQGTMDAGTDATVRNAFMGLTPQQQWNLAGTGTGGGVGSGLFGGFLENNGGMNSNQFSSWINNNAYGGGGAGATGNQITGLGGYSGATNPGPSGTLGYSGTSANPGGPGPVGGGGANTGPATPIPGSPYSGGGQAGAAVGQMDPGNGVWNPNIKATYDPGQTGDYLGSYNGQYYGQGNVPSAANGWGTAIPGSPPQVGQTALGATGPMTLGQLSNGGSTLYGSPSTGQQNYSGGMMGGNLASLAQQYGLGGNSTSYQTGNTPSVGIGNYINSQRQAGQVMPATNTGPSYFPPSIKTAIYGGRGG